MYVVHCTYCGYTLPLLSSIITQIQVISAYSLSLCLSDCRTYIYILRVHESPFGPSLPRSLSTHISPGISLHHRRRRGRRGARFRRHTFLRLSIEHRSGVPNPPLLLSTHLALATFYEYVANWIPILKITRAELPICPMCKLFVIPLK